MPQLSIITVLAYLILVTTGCAAPTPKTQTTTPGQQSDLGATTQDRAEIEQLLNEAERAMSELRLTTPTEDNAYLRYLQVLARNPDNREAVAGLKKIAEIYLAWAVEAMDRDQFTRAKNMLNKANSVDEHHTDLPILWKRLEKAKKQTKTTFPIDSEAIARRSDALAQDLQSLARKAEKAQATVKIRAPSDNDARWIYQQMNLATETRIRATIQTGAAPSVQLSYP